MGVLLEGGLGGARVRGAGVRGKEMRQVLWCVGTGVGDAGVVIRSRYWGGKELLLG